MVDEIEIEGRISISVINVFIVLMAILALILINRTKRTPKLARFLSTGLLSFDVAALMCFSVRKFLPDADSAKMVQVVGIGFLSLSFATVGIMSFERLIVFYSPNYYMRVFQKSRVKTVVIVIWIFIIVVYFLARFVPCFFVYSNPDLATIVGVCSRFMRPVYSTFIALIAILSIMCYSKIFLIIRSENMFNSAKTVTSRMKQFKATSLVFVFVSTILMVSSFYVVILFSPFQTYQKRVFTDVVDMVNGVADSVLYVLWYKECRMELLKLFVTFSPKSKEKCEQMKIEIFHIPIYEQTDRRNCNCTKV